MEAGADGWVTRAGGEALRAAAVLLLRLELHTCKDVVQRSRTVPLAILMEVGHYRALKGWAHAHEPRVSSCHA
jgi:hypothetical protein